MVFEIDIAARSPTGHCRVTAHRLEQPSAALGPRQHLEAPPHTIQGISASLKESCKRRGVTCWHPETITTRETRGVEDDWELVSLLLCTQSNLLSCSLC